MAPELFSSTPTVTLALVTESSFMN
jgi:hypothetical protein